MALAGQAQVVKECRRLMLRSYPEMPSSESARASAFAGTIARLLQSMLALPPPEHVEVQILVALRPIHRLEMSSLGPTVCRLLYALRRGHWVPYLTTPQLWIIRTALAETLPALPPESLRLFWKELESSDPMIQSAMRLGLEFLRAAHATPHLLLGLELSGEHITRSRIVDCLEQIAEPSAIPALVRLRLATAETDWTLSRQIARCIRVIEQQNSGENERLLLRPSGNADGLLRPASLEDNGVRKEETASLLRPAHPYDASRGAE